MESLGCGDKTVDVRAGSQWVILERTNGQEIEGRAGVSESEILRTSQ